MDGLLKKLNLKAGTRAAILNLPDDLAGLPDAIQAAGAAVGDFSPDSDFILAFVNGEADIARLAAAGGQTQGDVVVWGCYRKSKPGGSGINRDRGWGPMGESGFEPVRQVSINETWSALRFRRVEFIKTMTRSFAMTEEGRAKSKGERG